MVESSLSGFEMPSGWASPTHGNLSGRTVNAGDNQSETPPIAAPNVNV